jgi:hypothetical protein
MDILDDICHLLQISPNRWHLAQFIMTQDDLPAIEKLLSDKRISHLLDLPDLFTYGGSCP